MQEKLEKTFFFPTSVRKNQCKIENTTFLLFTIQIWIFLSTDSLKCLMWSLNTYMCTGPLLGTGSSTRRFEKIGYLAPVIFGHFITGCHP